MSVSFQSETARRSWGRVVKADHLLARLGAPSDAQTVFDKAREVGASALPYGLGRSYGDSNLNPDGVLADMSRSNRFITFDLSTGLLRAEAGLSLDEILSVIVPKGFFLPTTPGSRYVTLGGAIANDVHGKNHHSAGSFGTHVRALTLARSDGSITTVTPQDTPELFACTVGGLGLTGIILDAEIQLVPIQSALIDQVISPMPNVEAFFEIAEARASESEHTVAWVDCTARGERLGQGVFSTGDWSQTGPLTPHKTSAGLSFPMDAPGFALNAMTLKAFNSLYRRRQLMKPAASQVHYAGFFHPLDSIRDWNRLYGQKGFYQYQSVIPFESALPATRDMLDRIAKSGEGSFLAVLKSFGSIPSPGVLSFPRPGVTLALDFANRGPRTLALMAELDAIVREAGGRLYPAKDGRMTADMFQLGYPEWRRVEAQRDPLISSAFWRRVSQ